MKQLVRDATLTAHGRDCGTPDFSVLWTTNYDNQIGAAFESLGRAPWDTRAGGQRFRCGICTRGARHSANAAGDKTDPADAILTKEDLRDAPHEP